MVKLSKTFKAPAKYTGKPLEGLTEKQKIQMQEQEIPPEGLTPEQQAIASEIAGARMKVGIEDMPKPYGGITQPQPTLGEIQTFQREQALARNPEFPETSNTQIIEPQGIIGKSLAESPLGLFQKATGAPILDVTTPDIERLGRTAGATGAALGAAALIPGGATTGSVFHIGKTVQSILKLSKLTKAFAGVALLSFIREPIKEIGGYLSGTTDIDIALSDTANDLKDINDNMLAGLSPNDALTALEDIDTNLNSLNQSLHNMNMLSKLFYVKKGLSQQRDALKLLKKERLMKFSIRQDQIIMGPNRRRIKEDNKNE